MQAYIKCDCQQKLFEAISQFIGQEIKCTVDAKRCDTTLVDGKIEIETVPAILLYLIKEKQVYSSKVDQYIQYVNQLLAKLQFVYVIIDNPKNSQPKLQQYAMQQIFDFVQCMNDNILAGETFLGTERKSLIDVFANFVLQNTFRTLITEEKAKSYPHVCRYMKTVNNGQIEYAKQELKFGKH